MRHNGKHLDADMPRQKSRRANRSEMEKRRFTSKDPNPEKPDDNGEFIMVLNLGTGPVVIGECPC